MVSHNRLFSFIAHAICSCCRFASSTLVPWFLSTVSLFLLSNNSQQGSYKLQPIRLLSLQLKHISLTHLQYVSGKAFAFNSSLSAYLPLLSLPWCRDHIIGELKLSVEIRSWVEICFSLSWVDLHWHQFSRKLLNWFLRLHAICCWGKEELNNTMGCWREV